MRTLGNILWFIFGGFGTCITWLCLGIIYCISLVGIPFGLQAFKIMKLSAWPFGKQVTQTDGGSGRVIGNIIWIIFGGLGLAVTEFLLGIVCFITIIGIPFGKQHFKLAKLSLAPFGVEITTIPLKTE